MMSALQSFSNRAQPHPGVHGMIIAVVQRPMPQCTADKIDHNPIVGDNG
jgi:hypothetical protein